MPIGKVGMNLPNKKQKKSKCCSAEITVKPSEVLPTEYVYECNSCKKSCDIK